jgi:hypothetical protein
MNKTTLEFKVAIEADKATLHQIQHQLNGANSRHPALTNVLPVTIKETLLAAGVTNDFEVELQPGHIINHYKGVGGLSEDFCLMLDEASHRLNKNQAINTGAYPDDILCSD